MGKFAPKLTWKLKAQCLRRAETEIFRSSLPVSHKGRVQTSSTTSRTTPTGSKVALQGLRVKCSALLEEATSDLMKLLCCDHKGGCLPSAVRNDSSGDHSFQSLHQPQVRHSNTGQAWWQMPGIPSSLPKSKNWGVGKSKAPGHRTL